MDLITSFFQILVHLDQHLFDFAQQYGVWIYGLLFLIIFCETGLVVTPFLPGDSLLFVAGAVAGIGAMNVHLLVVLLILAAILGDNTNYWIGRFVGPRVFRRDDTWFFKRSYVDRANAFFEKHGGKTLIIARFLPIVRTYVPFVAGIGKMPYQRFLPFDILGGFIWITSLTYAGYVFGNIPLVKKNLTLVILAIIFVSLLPGIIETLRHRAAARP
ncbi:MAG: DedA family protein [Betaproteobacteria bacterium]|nr:DedA family protein [Betaproteobacteria bacterium]